MTTFNRSGNMFASSCDAACVSPAFSCSESRRVLNVSIAILAMLIFVISILSGLHLVAVLMIMSLLVWNVLAGEQVKNNVFADSTETTSNFAARVS